MKQPKVVLIANDTTYVYNLRKEIIEALIGQGYEVIIISHLKEHVEKLSAMGCRVIGFKFERQGKNPFEDIRLLFFFLNVLSKEKPDMVLSYNVKPNVYGGIACRMLGLRYMPNITGLGTPLQKSGLLSHFIICLYRLGLSGASCVFFQNSENEKFMREKAILRKDTPSVLLPGSGVSLKRHCLEEYPDERQPVGFLFIGRLKADKGVGELFAATKTMHEKNEEVFTHVVGGCDDDYEAQLKDSEKNGIIYHGLQPDVHGFIRDAHCVVLPSYHEGMANVLLEAAATGRPVIATRVPGCRETYDEGVTGLGCRERDADSLYKAMDKFIRMPYAEKAKMGLAGRKKMEQQFDRQIVVKMVLDKISEYLR